MGRYEDPDPMGAAGRVADWIELSALVDSKPTVSKTTVIDHLVESGLLSGDDDADSQAEEIAASAFHELGIRKLKMRSLGHYAFPFELDAKDTVLRRDANWASHLAHTFLLFVSSMQLQNKTFLKGTSAHEIGHLFEEVVQQALIGIFSTPVEILAASGKGAKAHLSARVESLLRQFNREITAKLPNAPRRIKDGGLDLVARLSLGDDRPGCSHVLVQCSAGADWTEKLNTPDEARWREWVSWRGPIYRAFAVPTLFGTESALEDASRDGSWTMILDRTRILYGLNRLPGLATKLESRLKRWCRDRISHLKNANLLA